LQQNGYRLTPARSAVLYALQSGNEHDRPEDILARGRAIYPALSRATVYRTLELLGELGVLRPIHLGERGSRVANVQGGHSHFVCLSCGKVIHFEEDAAIRVAPGLSRRLGMRIQGHLLELYGHCADCERVRAAAASGKE
jgi:Fe2+ or Zn2+ uptake regulation protein